MFNLSWEVLVALLGVVAASLPQLTSNSRLRGQISFWTSQVQSQNLDYDRQVAESSRRDAAARLLALQAYPARRLLLPLYGTLLVPLVGYTLVLNLSEPERISLRFLVEYDPGLFLVSILFGAASLFECLQILRQRHIIIRNYLDGELLERKEIVFRPAPPIYDIPLGIHLSLQLLGVLLLSCGLFLLSIFFFASAALGSFIPWEGNAERPSDLFGLFMSGTLLTLIGISAIYFVLSLEQYNWINPRPLSAKASKPVTPPSSAPPCEAPTDSAGRGWTVNPGEWPDDGAI
ncbi:hypothetical protein [Arthrobacter sunyaminii]|uniref:hypothetical protein n=1 Tax=Arthrobacter sunyaminii TaxID=2816859 RepID=UPI001A93BDC9|nr:hypothetical protein [Arthrobacter sunyaminii]MBO0910121.1 hypothetical protein [Arthrobacter sunyaminii]